MPEAKEQLGNEPVRLLTPPPLDSGQTTGRQESCLFYYLSGWGVVTTAAAAALGIEPRAQGMHGKHLTTDTSPALFLFSDRFSLSCPGWTWTYYLAQLGLDLARLLSCKAQLLCRFLSNSFLAVLSHYNSRLEISQFQVGKLLRK